MDLLPPGPELDKVLAEVGVEITHFFVGDQYAKLVRIPKGAFVGQHKHKFAHDATLLLGEVTVRWGTGIRWTYTAPCCLRIPAGEPHEVVAVTDALWACLWPNPTGETDPAKFDREVIA